mmetsp:Transcript_17503/g.50081  ORF Transcript_17503/g.50081 Transcript_17503/m.50081 type:complete len:404 (-) Transcript_17503:47-1258(-)
MVGTSNLIIIVKTLCTGLTLSSINAHAQPVGQELPQHPKPPGGETDGARSKHGLKEREAHPNLMHSNILFVLMFVFTSRAVCCGIIFTLLLCLLLYCLGLNGVFNADDDKEERFCNSCEVLHADSEDLIHRIANCHMESEKDMTETRREGDESAKFLVSLVTDGCDGGPAFPSPVDLDGSGKEPAHAEKEVRREEIVKVLVELQILDGRCGCTTKDSPEQSPLPGRRARQIHRVGDRRHVDSLAPQGLREQIKGSVLSHELICPPLLVETSQCHRNCHGKPQKENHGDEGFHVGHDKWSDKGFLEKAFELAPITSSCDRRVCQVRRHPIQQLPFFVIRRWIRLQIFLVVAMKDVPTQEEQSEEDNCEDCRQRPLLTDALLGKQGKDRVAIGGARGIVELAHRK